MEKKESNFDFVIDVRALDSRYGEAANSQDTNHVVYGANDVRLDLTGYSVSEVEGALVETIAMTPGVDAYVNGKLIKDKSTRILQPGERIEFMPPPCQCPKCRRRRRPKNID